MTEKQIERLKRNGLLKEAYAALVSKKIKRRFSLSDELALLRQREEKPEEFSAYNAFAEACKAEAKEELGGEIP